MGQRSGCPDRSISRAHVSRTGSHLPAEETTLLPLRGRAPSLARGTPQSGERGVGIGQRRGDQNLTWILQIHPINEGRRQGKIGISGYKHLAALFRSRMVYLKTGKQSFVRGSRNRNLGRACNQLMSRW